MQTFCREHDSSLHTSCTPILSIADLMHTRCRILADSVHTLRRANQCHSNAAAWPQGPAGGGGRRPCAMPRRFARGGQAAAREGEAAAREGEVAARECEAAARVVHEYMPKHQIIMICILMHLIFFWIK
jgi:hypothetical protein